ncbi:hypothetical protein [Spirosoma profusum]|nr:hypothetical protein [Spirosoma profusum]
MLPVNVLRLRVRLRVMDFKINLHYVSLHYVAFSIYQMLFWQNINTETY